MIAVPYHIVGAIALLAVCSAYVAWLALAGDRRVARTVRTNLQRGMPRIGTAAAGHLVRHPGLGRRVVGPRITGWLERLIVRAGRPERWPVDRVVTVKLLVALAAFVVGLMIVLRTGTPQSVALGFLLVLFAFFLPDLLLWNAGIKRRQEVQLELPDTLDQMSIAVEAGLGFDAAMVRVARNGKGVLAGELIRTLQDIQVGQPRRVAYEALASRLSVPDLRRFIRAVIQAEEYGIPLSDVLNTQAREMRIARRQRAERTAMEIPVKVSFPLVLFLLPALMIVILGPAILSIVAVLAG